MIQVAALQKNLHEPLLKEDLECWRCEETFKTMPKLKEHLTREKVAEASKMRNSLQVQKRESPEDGDANDGGDPSSQVTPNIIHT